MLFNGHGDPETMAVPVQLVDRWWSIELDTARPKAPGRPVVGSLIVDPWSVVVLRESEQ